jgi:hypothetical protein
MKSCARCLFLPALAGVLAFAIAACSRPVNLPNGITKTQAQQIASSGRPEARDVRFGERFILRGATIMTAGDGLILDLAWESTAKQHLQLLVPIHMVDESGQILTQADYHQQPPNAEVRSGTLWHDAVFLPYEQLKDAAAVAIGLKNEGDQWLLADRGPRDWGNRRLLIPLPIDAVKAATSTSLQGYLEVADCSEIVGWVWDRKQQARALEVEILDGENLLQEATASDARQDLAGAGIGDGKHGFHLPTPAALKDGKPHTLRVRVKGSEFELRKSPRTITCPGA